MKKTVVITGAGSGLGASLAKQYDEMGYYICLLGRTEEKLIQVSKSLKNKSSYYLVDVSIKEEVSRTFNQIKKEVGEIDILINSAGLGVFDLAESLNESAVHAMIDTNLKGTIFSTQEVLPQMKNNNQGAIVNIISTAGLEGKATESVYCASKFGVRGFTESLIVETKATNVFVCGVYMGGMQTEFWDGIFDESKTNSFMTPDDVAKTIIASTTQKIIPSEIVIKSKK